MTLSFIPSFMRKIKIVPSVSKYSDSTEKSKRSSSLHTIKEQKMAPIETWTNLIVRNGLFSRNGDAYPIKTIDGALYQDLRVREKEHGGHELIIIEDAFTREPVLVIVRYVSIYGHRFHIYVTNPTFDQQEPIDCTNVRPKHRLFPFARVEKDHSSSTLHVFDAENDFPMPAYTIQRTQSLSYSTEYEIKHHGKTVASTCKQDENSHLLKVKRGTDACLMYCLVLIADEFY
jgi:hypothetical protein